MSDYDHVQLTRPAASFADQILSLRVDRSIPVPAYAQIADELRDLLRPGVTPGDTELPSERLLCEAFHVSRMTVRQALETLEREGLIERRRGRGTFVPLHPARTEHYPSTVAEAMSARIAAGSVKLLSFRRVRPSAAAREFFGLSYGERVYQIRRLRMADAAPVALEVVQIPPTLCPKLDAFDLVRDSLHRIFQEHYDLQPAECTEEISAALPGPAWRVLQAHASTAILLICRKTYSAGAVPIEFAVTAYRGDLFTAVVRSGLSPAGCEGNTRNDNPFEIAGGELPRPAANGS